MATITADPTIKKSSAGAGIATVLGLEWGIFLLFLALILFQGGWILVTEIVLVTASIFYLNRNPHIKQTIAINFQTHRSVALLGAAVAIVIFPFTMYKNAYWLYNVVIALSFVVATLGLNLQRGTGGMVNLAGAAFYGVGAYTAGLLALSWGWPPWLTLLCGGVVTAVSSIFLFIPVMKTKGHYLALVTIAFQFIVVILLDSLEFTGGPQGLKNIPLFSLFGYSFNTEVTLFGLTFPTYVNFYFLAVFMTVVTIIVANRIYQSWVGVTLATIRDDEIAAQTSGVEINKWKLIAFSFGNFFIGIAGAFYAHMVGFISPPNFVFEKSLVMVSIVILGGMDSVVGVVLGAFLLILLPEKLRFISDYRFLIYGLVLIIMLIFRPRGILPFKSRGYQGFAASNRESEAQK